jgi:hypothetical protein
MSVNNEKLCSIILEISFSIDFTNIYRHQQTRLRNEHFHFKFNSLTKTLFKTEI